MMPFIRSDIGLPDLSFAMPRSDDRSPPPVSVCIVCRNEADKLEPCLESLDWADEILVLDLNSTDDSASIAQAHGAKVIQREPLPVVEWLRNEIAAAARNDWILALDPDERVTPGLAQELERVVRGENPVDAVIIPRMNVDLGYPPSHPLHRYEPQLRMYRRSRVEWPDVPNALPKVPEQRLHRIAQHDDLVLVHDRSRNIPEVLERSIRYAPAQAQSMIDRGQTFTARAMLVALGKQARKQLIRGEAWKDGVPGLLRAGIIVGFHFYVWAAFWQLSGAERTAEDDRVVARLGKAADGLYRAWRGGTLPLRLARQILRGK
jgi:glycosyltransferase involved in cell wall biosynthesis